MSAAEVRIAELEAELAAAQETTKQVALSAEEHVLELENEISLLKSQIRLLEDYTVKSYVSQIQRLEEELKLMRKKERESKEVSVVQFGRNSIVDCINEHRSIFKSRSLQSSM